MQYDLVGYIGRFEMFHNGHLTVVKQALAVSTRVVLLVGSAGKHPDARSPWTYAERESMIFAALKEELGADYHRVSIEPIFDHPFDDQQWIAGVQLAMSNNTKPTDTKMALIGYAKDETSYYLNIFGGKFDVIQAVKTVDINATDLREDMFAGGATWQASVPAAIAKYINLWKAGAAFGVLAREHQYIREYKKSWEAAPYPVILVTVDAVVVQSGHILMITRKSAPGEGLLALPGGFVEHTEPFLDAVLRELTEETRIKVPAPVLIRSITDTKLFDAPRRSLRGRVITQAYKFELDSTKPLPQVKGRSDAKKAEWIPLSEVREDQCFEDHYHIIQAML